MVIIFTETTNEVPVVFSTFCLDIMQLEQMIRKLPQCRHIFHQSCCDEWIRKELRTQWKYKSNVTSSGIIDLSFTPIELLCPLCRTGLPSVLTDEPEKPEAAHVSER